MIEPKNWKKIPDRMQNAYSLMRKFSQKRLYQVNPLKIPRQKLPPINSSFSNDLSQTSQSLYDSPVKPDLSKTQDNEESILVKEEVAQIIKTSLKMYPKLENYIKKLQKEKIPCKCSVFSKNIQSLDRVHGFSTVACASDYCINRILEEPDDQPSTTMKSPEYYSLNTNKPKNKELNQDLLLYEQSLDKINKAVNFINANKNSEKEYMNLYAEYIKPPKGFRVPRYANLSPNFSVPKPVRKRYVT